MLASAERIYLILACFACWVNWGVSPFRQQLTSKVDQYLDSQLLENHFDGEVLVSSGGTILAKRKFQPPSALNSDEEAGEKEYPVGAIAEQFVAAAILQLEAGGQVSLEKSICAYIADCPSQWNNIHVFHLLTHSSGLPGLTSAQQCVDHSSPLAESQELSLLSKDPVLFKPGSRFSRNNSDYLLLSFLIERVSGQPTRDYLAQHIFAPLKMTHTSYGFGTSHGPAEAGAKSEPCHQGQLPPGVTQSPANSRTFSTTNDLYQWDNALLAGQFLSKKSLDEMFTPYVEGYGFGFKVVKEFDRKAVFQNDQTQSYTLSNRIYPDDGAIILVLSSTPAFPAPALSHDLGAVLFGKHYPPLSISSTSPAPN
jgi:CubicO group peptidase (beta-lactamase class C family)